MPSSVQGSDPNVGERSTEPHTQAAGASGPGKRVNTVFSTYLTFLFPWQLGEVRIDCDGPG
jgi:hypothetical protein